MFRRCPFAVVIFFLVPALACSEPRFEEMKLFTDRVPESEYDFEMVPIPKGSVDIDDPANPGQKRTVEVGPFWIGKTEVTWEMFDPWMNLEERAFMLDLPPDPDGITGPSPPYVPPDQGWGHEGYAALTLSHKSATDFCRWISRELKKKYRLPTEAEWEYVCRAGAESVDSLDDYAWHGGNAEEKTHPVASKQPNTWGVHDMLGNAGEWCDGLDGVPVLAGGWYATPPAELSCSAKVRETKEMKRKWLDKDPQVPQSVFWLAGPTFHGFRLLCEGPVDGATTEE